MNSSFYLILYLLMIPAVTCAQMMYTTDFDSTENPISENGKWKSGRCTGLDWTDVRIINGMACGTQSGIDSGITMYNDSYAFWTIGNPGIGFFLSGCSGTNTSFGFKSFTAKGL